MRSPDGRERVALCVAAAWVWIVTRVPLLLMYIILTIFALVAASFVLPDPLATRTIEVGMRIVLIAVGAVALTVAALTFVLGALAQRGGYEVSGHD